MARRGQWIIQFSFVSLCERRMEEPWDSVWRREWQELWWCCNLGKWICWCLFPCCEIHETFSPSLEINCCLILSKVYDILSDLVRQFHINRPSHSDNFFIELIQGTTSEASPSQPDWQPNNSYFRSRVAPKEHFTLNQNRSTWLLTGTNFESWACRKIPDRMSGVTLRWSTTCSLLKRK